LLKRVAGVGVAIGSWEAEYAELAHNGGWAAFRLRHPAI